MSLPMLQAFLDFLLRTESVSILGISVLVMGLQVVSRVLTKLSVFAASAEAEAGVRRAARFECLRIGVDLSYLGLTAFFAVGWVALARVDLSQFAPESIYTLAVVLALVHFFLILGAILATGRFDSPEKTYWLGLYVPNIIGWCSLTLSATLLFFVISASG